MLQPGFEILRWWVRSPLIRLLLGAGAIWLLSLSVGLLSPTSARLLLGRGLGYFVWIAGPFLLHELTGGERGALLVVRPIRRTFLLLTLWFAALLGWAFFLLAFGLPAVAVSGNLSVAWIGLLWVELAVYTAVILTLWLWTRRVYLAIGLNFLVHVLDYMHDRALQRGMGWPLLEYLLPAGTELSRIVHAWPVDVPPMMFVLVVTSTLVWLGLALWRIRTMEF